MNSMLARLLAIVAGCALVVGPAGAAAARGDDASADAADAQDEPIAPDDEDAADDEELLEIYDDPDEDDEGVDDDEDDDSGGDGPGGEVPGEDGGAEDGTAASLDEELRTMGRFLGGAQTSVEAPDGTLRPPARLPVIGRAGGSQGDRAGGANAGGGGGASPSGGGSGAAGAKPGKSGGRIFGGTIVREGMPWQAQLYAPFPIERWSEASRKGREPWEVRHYCGGSLIAPEWVLTAAHCLYEGMAEKGFRIRLGVRDISRDEGVSFPIVRIVFHPGWDEKKSMYVNDIALVRIAADKPMPGTAVDPARPPAYAPIPLHRGPPPGDRQPVRALGWGKTRDVTVDKASAALLQVDMNVLAEPRCAALPGYGPTKIHSGVVCASAPGRQTCRGDSGGPIVFRDGAAVLVGVVSWGKERCVGDDQPGVYTRVGAYAPWIDSVIRASAR